MMNLDSINAGSEVIDIISDKERFKDKFTVVIPVLNEEESIGYVLDELLELGIEKDKILVVDGGSSDKTVDAVRDRGVKVIKQEGSGKGMAILTASKHVSTPYMLVMDGDYTYNPNKVWDMVGKALENGCVEVIGYRETRENIPLLHRFGNWVLTKVFNLLFGTNLKDVCSGMYLVKTEIVRDLAVRTKGFEIEVEIAAASSQEGDIMEIPIEYRKRIGQQKLSTWRHGIGILLSIIYLSWWYNPIFLLFITGSLVLIPSMLLAGWVLYRYLFFGIKHYVWGLISVAGGTAGIVMLAIAIISIYIKRVEQRIIRELRKLRKLRNN